tara:strand:- start:2604 stop:4034 length:1431 start_codon:yes stop_codon:yes gene_type:complete
MSIEQLGESLLSQARKKSKKGERRAKIFTGLMLGVQGANIVLRNRAKKRLDSFVNSNIGIIDNKSKQFQAGVNFWTDHNNMLKTYGMGTTDTDWKNAYRQKQYDLYKQRELGQSKLSSLTADKLKEFETMVNPLIEDDIAAYDKKLELFKNFKNIKDTAENRKLFLAPTTNKLAEAKNIINKEANVGSYILNRLGFRERGIEEIDVDGQQIVLPKRMSAEEKKVIVDNIKLNKLFLRNLDDIEKTVEYTPFTDEQIAQFVSPSSFKSKIPDDFNRAFNNAVNNDPSSVFLKQNYSTSLSDKKLNILKIYKQIEKNQEAESADMFKSDVISFAMEARKQYEANPDNEGKPKSPDYFLDIGLREYIKNSELISEKVKTAMSQREQNQRNQQFMSAEFDFDGVKITPRQIQTQFDTGKYNQEQMENIYEELVKRFKDEPMSEGFLNNLKNFIDLETERTLSSFFQYESTFRKNPLTLPE